MQERQFVPQKIYCMFISRNYIDYSHFVYQPNLLVGRTVKLQLIRFLKKLALILTDYSNLDALKTKKITRLLLWKDKLHFSLRMSAFSKLREARILLEISFVNNYLTMVSNELFLFVQKQMAQTNNCIAFFCQVYVQQI